MDVRPLDITGAWEFTPKQHGDSRGLFAEWYKEDVFRDNVGYPLHVAQSNLSVSARGTLRGIHFARLAPSQAKYVFCPQGSILDVVVDLRTGSPTYGQHEVVRLDDVDRKALYVGEGLGHGFYAEQDGSTVTYLVTAPYAPSRELEVHPLDPALGIAWPQDVEPLLSPKDLAAPTLQEANDKGLLPAYEECLAFYDSLRGRGQ
ncbi:MAG: dTDP-4-dehydrorhamnose 3,5-epimerase [Frankiales bacterium]|jgi:dTDP-4-dehydrorhamnose 3,5-epimerase|nr:dTDP-4-dehydrorhamnose 3,5-epimerase [Frankiales bacterium]